MWDKLPHMRADTSGRSKRKVSHRLDAWLSLLPLSSFFPLRLIRWLIPDHVSNFPLLSMDEQHSGAAPLPPPGFQYHIWTAEAASGSAWVLSLSVVREQSRWHYSND